MSPQISLSEDHRDALQEITNVAMGQAGDHLARLLDTFVILSIPKIQVMHPSDMVMALQAVDESFSASAVCQGFIGRNIAGEAMLLFNDTSFDDLAKLMKYPNDHSLETECELLMDTTNILFGACLNGIAEQLDMEFSYDAPVVLGQHQPLTDLLDMKHVTWQQALVIEINYHIEGYQANCDLLIVFTHDSLDMIFKKLNYMLK